MSLEARIVAVLEAIGLDMKGVAAQVSGKVDKVAGKVLSSNDFTDTERTKLTGIATGATKNATDAQLRDRSTHTGAQAISTVTGLQYALDGKESAGVAASQLTAHTNASDPHPQYATAGEAAAAAPVQSVAGRTGAVTLSKADVGLSAVDNTADSAKPVSTAQQAALDEKANLASPALTGTPSAPTAADGTNTTQVATTAFVQSAVGGYLSKSVTGGSVTLTGAEASNPVIAFSGTLTSNLTVVVPTTVKRLWAIYNNTSGTFTVTVKTAAGTGVTVAQGKRNLVYTDGTNVYDGFNDFESVALTGTSTAPTAAANTNTTQVATTAFVLGQAATATPQALGTAAVGNATRFARENHVHAMPTLDALANTAITSNTAGELLLWNGTAWVNNTLAEAGVAPVASPTLTGTPNAPTAAANTNTTQVATTAFVLGQAATATPQALGTAAVGNATRFARENHVHAMPTLDALANTTITSNTTGEILRWDGTAWVNATLAEAGIAPVASPSFTGTPAAPTAADGTSTTQLATTAFVQGAVGGYLSKSTTGGTITLTTAEASNPVLRISGALTADAVLEIPASTRRIFSISNSTTGAFTLTVKHVGLTPSITVAQGKRQLVYTNGAGAYDAITDFESIALTGTPTAPTAAANTNTTQIATTAFVLGQASTAGPQALGTAAVGSSTRFARENHVHAMPKLDELANTTITSAATGQILRRSDYSWVNATLAEAGIAPVASPAFTGTPSAPTATAGTNTTQIATTAFATAAANAAKTTFSSAAENAAGTVSNKAVDPLGIREAFNATGSAPVFACRAWVNFNGTGTVAIRASGNVSSITDNGVGDYTVNFTDALADANYAVTATVKPNTASYSDTNSNLFGVMLGVGAPAQSTTQCRIVGKYGSLVTLYDLSAVSLAIFR